MILFYLALLLVQNTNTTFSTNQMRDNNQSKLRAGVVRVFPHFPTLLARSPRAQGSSRVLALLSYWLLVIDLSRCSKKLWNFL